MDLRAAYEYTETVHAYGTSEGDKKGWDTRGRGQHGDFTPAANVARMGGLLLKYGYQKTESRQSGGTYQKKENGKTYTAITSAGGWVHRGKGMAQGIGRHSLAEHLKTVHGEF